jgi:hypothetical protein
MSDEARRGWVPPDLRPLESPVVIDMTCHEKKEHP